MTRRVRCGSPAVVRALLAALALVTDARASAEAGASRVADVRVWAHRKYTRVVFELDGPATYRIAQEQRQGRHGTVTELVVHLGARGAFEFLDAVADSRLPDRGVVDSVRMEDWGPGRGIARIRLDTVRPLLRHRMLEDPYRIVIDVGRRPIHAAQLRAWWSEGEGEWRGPLGRVVEAPEQHERREELTRRPEEKRPEEPLGLPLFGRPLVISGDLETRLAHDGDRRLGRRDDDRAVASQQLELELFYEVGARLSLFAESKAEYRWEFYREAGGAARDWTVERGETWLHVGDDLGGTDLGLQVGRQDVRDEREWWWDEKLDTVRLFSESDRFRFQVLLGQELAPEAVDEGHLDPEQEDVVRLLASTGWQYARRHRLDLFFLGQRDRSRAERPGRLVDAEREDEVDADLAWLGVRASGRWDLGGLGALRYWGEGGGVYGDERVADFDGVADGWSRVDEVRERRVLGWGADVGLTWQTGLPVRPALTVAYAFGSGDPDPDDDRVRSFRQTGLHDNEAKLGGETRVRYYGELFDPELSNLHVATAALALPLPGSSSLTFLYHYYRQVHPSDALRDAGLRAEPGGRGASLGQGLDAVLGVEGWKRVRLELVGSVFRAGAAYEESRGELAYGAGLKLELGF